MLLRIRIPLPDRPGSLGQVARTMGLAGADIVQVVVLERMAGRAVDDFTVSWPAGTPLDRLRAGLAAAAGVRVVGLWPANGTPVFGGWDAELLPAWVRRRRPWRTPVGRLRNRSMPPTCCRCARER